MKFIEHMWPVTSSIATSDPGRMFNSPNDDYLMDLDKAPELIRLMVAENVYLNPTMMGRYAHISERGAEFAEEDELLLTFGEVFSDLPEALKPLTPAWMRRADEASPEARGKLVAGLQKVRTFIDLFDEAGGKVLAGTDVNPPRLPGVTMHRELLMLVDSGIPPYRALLGATRWAAEMMHKATLIGTVEEGKQADILVLGSDPLADISNTRDITYVIRKGIIRRTPEDCSVVTPPISVTCEK
jgi:imidazolonepropionase-like amidohydrolase